MNSHYYLLFSFCLFGHSFCFPSVSFWFGGSAGRCAPLTSTEKELMASPAPPCHRSKLASTSMSQQALDG